MRDKSRAILMQGMWMEGEMAMSLFGAEDDCILGGYND